MSELEESAAGAQSPRLIVGLGNPGAKYQSTRHNYGFFVIDELARRWGLEVEDLCASSFFSQEAKEIHLAKPLTFMNRSGMAVRCLAQRFGYAPSDVLVVYDDVALPLGTQRLRAKGSSGGHRGLASVIENLRTDEVPRLRLGIAAPLVQGTDAETGGAAEVGSETDLVSFVLEPFTDVERDRVYAGVEWAADACEAWLRYGIGHTMNHFNGSLPEG